jgi:hypothetical protein
MSRQLQSHFWLAIFLASMICTSIPFALPEIELSAIGGKAACLASDERTGKCSPKQGESCDGKWSQWYCEPGVAPTYAMIPEQQCKETGCIPFWYNKKGICDPNPGIICD